MADAPSRGAVQAASANQEPCGSGWSFQVKQLDAFASFKLSSMPAHAGLILYLLESSIREKTHSQAEGRRYQPVYSDPSDNASNPRRNSLTEIWEDPLRRKPPAIRASNGWVGLASAEPDWQGR